MTAYAPKELHPTEMTAAAIPRSAKFVVCALGIATFGPYLTGSIRTEQLAVYGLALAILIFTLPRMRATGKMRFLAPWLLYIVVALIGVAIPTVTATVPWAPGDPLAGIDNLASPLAVMLLIWTVVPAVNAEALLQTISRITATAMSLNGILAIISTRVDISGILRPFWGAADIDVTTAANAAGMGRFSGIFNQPAEAGALYGIAGIAAIYVWRNRPALLALTLALTCAGGLISVSKVYIIGALPLIIFYWLHTQRGGHRVATLFGLGLVGFVVIQSGLLNQWVGFDYLARLANPTGGALAFYSGGRFETGSTVTDVSTAALTTNPLSGVGAGGWQVAYDGAIPETLVMGGLIGLTVYATVVIAVFTVAKRIRTRNLRTFGFLFAIMVAGASLGLDPLTANRVSTIVWMTIALLTLNSQAQRSTGSE